MNVKRLVSASATAIAIGVTALTGGAGIASAQPGPPCGWQRCDGPGGPWRGDHRGPDGFGWPAPPTELAWRGIDQGRFDHQPFNYNGSWVTPIFDPGFNQWGFWFLGIWIPL
jgi:hypothetical protein